MTMSMGSNPYLLRYSSKVIRVYLHKLCKIVHPLVTKNVHIVISHFRLYFYHEQCNGLRKQGMLKSKAKTTTSCLLTKQSWLGKTDTCYRRWENVPKVLYGYYMSSDSRVRKVERRALKLEESYEQPVDVTL